MTAETRLPLELPDLSNNNSNKAPPADADFDFDGNKSLSFYPDLPNANAKGNHQHHRDHAQFAKDDADDNSYVFVIRNDDSPVLLDKDLNGVDSVHSQPPHIQNGQFLQTSSAEGKIPVVEPTEVASSINRGSTHKCHGDAFTVATEIIHQNGAKEGGADPDQIDSKPSPSPGENQESEVPVFLLESDVDLVHSPQPEIASLAVTESSHVCQNSHGDSLDSISEVPEIEELQDPQHASLEDATPTKSPELEVINPNSTTQQHSEPFDEFSGAYESQNAHSYAIQSESQQTEVQKVNPEKQFHSEPATVVEERVECRMPQQPEVHKVNLNERFITESSQFSSIGQRVEEETKTELPSEAKENQETIIGLSENGQPNLDEGLEDENSVVLLSATATASGSVLSEKEDHLLVSAFNDSVPDIQEFNEQRDDNEKPLELHQSSVHADTLVAAASCTKREIDIVDNLLESVESVQDSTTEHEFQHEASPLTENVISNSVEICKPEIEDADNVAVQSVEKVADLAREHEIEHEASSVNENVVVNTNEVIKPEAEVVYSVSGNLEGAISSGVKNAIPEVIPSKDVNDNVFVGSESIMSCSANVTISGTEFEPETADSKGNMLTFEGDDVHSKAEAGIVDVDCADTHPMTSDAEVNFEVENSSGMASRDLSCNNAVVSNTEVSDSAVVINESLPNSMPEIKEVEDQDDQLSGLDVKSDDKLICQESDDLEKSHNREIPVPLPENSYADPSAGHDLGFGPLMKTEVSDSAVVICESVPNSVPEIKEVEDQDDQLSGLDVKSDDKLMSQESEDVEKSHNRDISVPLPENSSADPSAGQDLGFGPVTKTEVSDSAVVISENVPDSVPEIKEVEDQDDQLSGLDVKSDDKLICQESGDLEKSHNREISVPLPENSFADPSAGQDLGFGPLTKSEVSDSAVVISGSVPNSMPEIKEVEDQDDQLSGLDVKSDDKLICQESEDLEKSHNREISVPLPEKSSADPSAGQDLGFGPLTKTEVSDSAVVISESVPNSVPGIKEVEDQDDQLSGLDVKSDDKLICQESGDLEKSHNREIFVPLPENSSADPSAGQDLGFGPLTKTEVSDSAVVISESVPNSVPEIKEVEDQDDQLPGLDVKSDDKLICQESGDLEKSHNRDISVPLPENSSADPSAGQDLGFGPLTKLFHFLIRMPRFDDMKVREQIRLAQLQVEEKTKHRDGYRLEIQKHKANCQGHAAEYEAAVSKARASKSSVKSKRAEIDSLQSLMNKVKNAMTVEDIDARIYSMEHMIQHETLPLKEEKRFIRDIKQLKQLREQLSSNIGSHDEVQQALNKRDEIEERLKILKKELDTLKDGVLKAEAVARAAQKKYEDESEKLKELISQFDAANDIRQAAYHHMQSLKRELFEKNKQFRTYKENAAAASDYAASKDREALHHLCVNQVETIMDLWNQNDEFRKEYVKCNVRSTIRRLGTLDGRSLGPDEEPPVLSNTGVERMDRLASKPANTSPELQTPILKQEKLLKLPVEDVSTEDTIKVNEVETRSQTAKSREPAKPNLGNGLATISGRGTSDEISEKEHMPTKEELELARKTEELRKEEAGAKLREQRRLEEKAKALEALERKKRIAEKAHTRAELRAQKEAEHREKEREKRLRKKEKKKVAGAEVLDSNNFVESTPSSESLTETIQEAEIKDNSPAVAKRHKKPSIFMKQNKTKSIPPPLRNRSRRKMQQWMWIIFICVFILVLFLLGHIGFYSNLSNLRQRSYGF